MSEARQKNLHRRRRRVIEALKRDASATAGELATELGVTAMAVRLNLYDLEA